MKFFARWNDRRWEMDVERDGEHLIVTVEGKTHRLTFDSLKTHYRSFMVDSTKVDFGWVRDGERYQIVLGGIPYEIMVKDQRSEQIESLRKTVAAAGHGEGEIDVRAPIPGLISKVLVKEGEAVARGRPLLTLDAMKMENELGAPRDGAVRRLLVSPGQTVDKGDLLAVIG